jgi:hypothetical protein
MAINPYYGLSRAQYANPWSALSGGLGLIGQIVGQQQAQKEKQRLIDAQRELALEQQRAADLAQYPGARTTEQAIRDYDIANIKDIANANLAGVRTRYEPPPVEKIPIGRTGESVRWQPTAPRTLPSGIVVPDQRDPRQAIGEVVMKQDIESAFAPKPRYEVPLRGTKAYNDMVEDEYRRQAALAKELTPPKTGGAAGRASTLNVNQALAFLEKVTQKSIPGEARTYYAHPETGEEIPAYKISEWAHGMADGLYKYPPELKKVLEGGGYEGYQFGEKPFSEALQFKAPRTPDAGPPIVPSPAMRDTGAGVTPPVTPRAALDAVIEQPPAAPAEPRLPEDPAFIGELKDAFLRLQQTPQFLLLPDSLGQQDKLAGAQTKRSFLRSAGFAEADISKLLTWLSGVAL